MSGNSTEGTKANAPTTEEGRGGLLPIALLGVILGIVALIVLWPSSENDADESEADRAAEKRGKGDGAGLAGARGGVVARDVDDPSRPAPKAKINPLLDTPVRGMAPTKPEKPADEPPPGASREEQIAFYEKQLADAVRNRDTRKVFADRLPAAKQRLEKSLNPVEAEATYERKAKIVEENLAKAEDRVRMLEKKLVELRGS